MYEGIVVIERTSSLMEAEIIRGLLESRGLTVHLSRESAATVFGLGVGPMAEVDVLVPTDQSDEAYQILSDYHAGRLEDDEQETDS